MIQQAIDFSRPAMSPRQATLESVRLKPELFRADFHDWLCANRGIWERFEHEATRVWLRGRRHYSARTLIEYIRHDTALSETGGDFKINGNYVPDLSRLYARVHPDRSEFFETRVVSTTQRLV